MEQPQTNTTPPKLDPDGSFRVTEFTALSLFAAAVFWVLFFISLSNCFDTQNISPNHRFYFSPILLSLGPAITYTYKAFRHRVYITVNASGIFLYETNITAWPNFIDASFKDEPKTGSIQENFILYIYYVKSAGELHEVRFKLGNTQNRGEEEVIAAIRYFYVQAGYSVQK